MPTFKIVEDGQGSGGFMCPPGHPAHTKSLQSLRGKRELSTFSLMFAVEDDYVPADVKAQVRKLLAEAELVESELWVRNVYGYFSRMYVPESGERAAGGLVQADPDELPAERHAAVACIREYFPDHAPRVDLIKDSSYCYGQYPCVKCGERVQYEARLDALAVYDSGTADCPKGGRHEWPAREEGASDGSTTA